MPIRNLIVGCDGTWNDTEKADQTNVIKILKACSTRNQITHYEEGVGTAHWEALPGGIYGAGLDRQILGAYRFLRTRLADREWARDNNRIFIFGFSRGSYAARRLAGLISQCGIPVKGSDVELAWQIYLKRDEASAEELKQRESFFDTPIEMVGVWDTVKTTTDEDFNDDILPKCVVAGYHAMAIDEKRKFFPILKWKSEERVKQRWFPGVHSDVGGGYAECGLSNIALHWMIDCAYKHGVNFKASSVKKIIDGKNILMDEHDSFNDIWKAFGTRKRFITKSALAHPCVQERLKKKQDYNPSNLPPDINYAT